ncbi:MAG: hypothetical protein ISQ17_00715 [Pelagibacteraceae bacterium]|nr:hypothetical protein [Pelagibacteraceae bacterium]
MTFFLILISICVVLLTISKIYGNKVAKKIIKVPFIIITFFLIIGVLFFLGYFTFEFIKENWIGLGIILIVIYLGLYYNGDLNDFENKSDRKNK